MNRFLLVCCFIVLVLGINAQESRSYDGYLNNVNNPEWGSVGDQLVRMTTVGYKDGISALAGSERPNPREISNALFSQEANIFNQLSLSDYVWVFGQFIDHDITLSENNVTEPLSIQIPTDDKHFPANSQMFMFRNIPMPGTGTSKDNPRQHVNSITSFIDASAVYGSTEERAQWLRTFENGKLKMSQGNLLPWNTLTGEFNDPKDPRAPFMLDDTHSGTKLFVAGDIRANENPLLLTFHTLFAREHNRMCDELKLKNPSWTDEQLYVQARRYIGAYMQNIVYNEWLPAMGVKVPEYRGYKDQVNPGIFNVFSSAAFRLGHTLINSNLMRMDNHGDEIELGHIHLKDAYFNPVAVLLSGGVEPYLIGMGIQKQQELDCKVIDDVRNFLFGAPGSGGLDLAAININRGRERGLPDYNTIRENFGLPRVKNFMEVTKNQAEADALKLVYGAIDNIDPWVGMLAEYHMPDALFGELIMLIIERQFQVIRDGDRFFFENDEGFSDEDKQEIRNTSLHNIIMRNTNIALMQKNVFKAMPHEMIPNGPDLDKRQLASIVYPNPTDGHFILKVYVDEITDVSVRIFGPDGRLIIDKVKPLIEGENFVELDISSYFAKGLYNIVLEAGFSYQILRVFKK